ncbi:pro-adrenomedullin-like isoform X1 [Paramormyrops kingsleyae]|uniref:pro-adrenomedullin-like isoform X1 n=2 Tax=Paramormyrops kingsleyae TaxID=1676925 RepID=UPI003B96CBED
MILQGRGGATERQRQRGRTRKVSQRPQLSVRMKLLLQTILCCSLLATFTLSVESAKPGLSSEMKKRLSIWLQSRTKRDLSGMGDVVQFVKPEDVRDAFSPHSSTDIRTRVRRSKSSNGQAKRSSCSLSTCAMNDLMDRLNKFNSQLRIGSAPMDKISPLGYGRRRRSLPAHRTLRQLRADRLQRLEKLLRRT